MMKSSISFTRAIVEAMTMSVYPISPLIGESMPIAIDIRQPMTGPAYGIRFRIPMIRPVIRALLTVMPKSIMLTEITTMTIELSASKPLKYRVRRAVIESKAWYMFEW